MMQPEGSRIVLSQINTLQWSAKRTGTQRRAEVHP